MTFQPSQNPPCIYCPTGKTTDVTPPDHPANERVYLCISCQRRFIVLFKPDPKQTN